MQLPPITTDPRLAPYEPGAERSLTVFGEPVLLAYLPSRRQRQDRPGAARPAFRPSPVPRILAEEVLWQEEGVAMTPNRYPFAREQRLLWSVAPRREPDLAMWTTICAWADACDGTALVNEFTIEPITVITGGAHYPSRDEIESAYAVPARRLLWVPGAAVATELGNKHVANIVLLGALSRLLPDIGEQDWIDAIQRQVKPSHREFNRRAFEIGRSDAHVPGPGV